MMNIIQNQGSQNRLMIRGFLLKPIFVMPIGGFVFMPDLKIQNLKTSMGGM
ncbi:hypothetical protein X474_13200 [Dethiosulfatarculus sandiegensis]|uniref:Uncharacterized protein n=1 Tax=Dethiosulfatarculus sandiegensis TaxID=1429043 RepID=A0A0D2JEH0_9BACT|nr:hypothetical protein X474_13200 [Dethiosulfatarculus sandiegensis]